MKKLFILYLDYPNTSGNHSGMAYLARQLKKKLVSKVILIKMPVKLNNYRSIFRKLWRWAIISFIKFFSGKNDLLFLMEYFGNGVASHQREISIGLRKRNYKNKIIGLVHLPGWHLLELFDADYIKNGVREIDKVMVLGSSLNSFFSDLGFHEKIIQTFHYVDIEYYRPQPKKQKNKKIKVITIGTNYRKSDQLSHIIEACPEMDFDVCMGLNLYCPVSHIHPNVSLHGYLDEDELLNLMQKADISLSVMKDTVGSNVITCSLACGLINIVSDVGSIRDYCDETNSVFCKSTNEFITALKSFKVGDKRIKELSKNASAKAETLKLDKYISWFSETILEEDVT